MQTNVTKFLSNEDFAQQLWFFKDSGDPPPGSDVTGQKGSVSPPEGSFIYLDVGCWIGSSDGKWGGANKTAIRRDFGIVCGPLVLLCTFSSAGSGVTADVAAWTAMKNQSAAHITSVSKVLDALSKTTNGLGTAIVRGVLVGDPLNKKWPDDQSTWVVHVIAGDMHLPAVDKKEQTYADTDMTVANASNSPRVNRHGRLNLAPLELLVTHLVGPKDTNGLDELVKLATWFMNHKKTAIASGSVAAAIGSVLALAELGPLLAMGGTAALAFTAVQDGAGIAENTMPKDQAEKWFKYYHEGVDGGMPADIFEGAGLHLVDFVQALVGYNGSRGNLLPVKFHQLGDMLDFWIGFTCHYTPSTPVNPHGAADDKKGTDYGADLVNTWADNMLSNTAAGQKVATAIDAAKGLSPVYLWGNHDNYLGGGLRPSYTGPSGRTTLDGRVATFEQDGIFMEHGHAADDANRDSTSILPLTGQLTGTNCPLGLFLTQAAFLRPQPVRGFEGTAAGFSAKMSGGVGSRLTQVIFAANKFFDSQGKFYVYVMGHTHVACLSKISVITKADAGALTKFRDSDDAKNSAVWFNQDGKGTPITSDQNQDGNILRDAKLHVGWKTMPGFEHHDWILARGPAGSSAVVLGRLVAVGRAGGEGQPRSAIPLRR